MRKSMYMSVVRTGMIGFGVVIEWKWTKRVHFLLGPVSVEIGMDY